MLILTRRVGETLMVGDDVTVTVLGVKGNQVRIGQEQELRFTRLFKTIITLRKKIFYLILNALYQQALL